MTAPTPPEPSPRIAQADLLTLVGVLLLAVFLALVLSPEWGLLPFAGAFLVAGYTAHKEGR